MLNQNQEEIPSPSKNNNNIANRSIISDTSSKVDLSQVDASEETMSQYSYPKEFLKLDLDKIREFIEILEEHYQNLVEQENMMQAKSAKQRLKKKK